MIHTKNNFSAGILELIVKLSGSIDGVTGHADGPGF